MSKVIRREIEVYADWAGLAQPTLVGFLYVTPGRGQEIFSFEYSPTWLSDYQEYPIDPSLQLYHGVKYHIGKQENFGVFMDSSPDRWGRVILDRREAQMAREGKREERQLFESDYLLGVYDEHRMGALRFRTDPKGPFLDSNKAQTLMWLH
jgi:serine/threonine-protein kinase HipA